MPPATLKLFISHSSEDRELVRLLVDLLAKALGLGSEHIRCTSLPGYGLPAGVSVEEKIRTEVEQAEVLIGLLSEASLESLYVAFELGARWHTGKPLIPLLAPGLDPVRVPDPLRGKHALHCSDDAQLVQLVENVGGYLGARPARNKRAASSSQVAAIRQYGKDRASAAWYGFEFTTPEEGADVRKRQVVVKGRFRNRPPDGALHIFHASIDWNRWWPFVGRAAEVTLDDDGSWSAEVEFEKGHHAYDCWVVLALVPRSSLELVRYFRDLPRYLAVSHKDGRGELEKHDEFNSLFGGIMPKGIQICARRKLHIAI